MARRRLALDRRRRLGSARRGARDAGGGGRGAAGARARRRGRPEAGRSSRRSPRSRPARSCCGSQCSRASSSRSCPPAAPRISHSPSSRSCRSSSASEPSRARSRRRGDSRSASAASPSPSRLSSASSRTRRPGSGRFAGRRRSAGSRSCARSRRRGRRSYCSRSRRQSCCSASPGRSRCAATSAPGSSTPTTARRRATGCSARRPRRRFAAERGILAAWVLGIGAFAFILGVISNSISAADIPKSLEQQLEKLGLASIATPSGYLSLTFLFFVFAIGLFACSQAAATRREEAEQLLETLFSLPVGRRRWLAGRIVLAAGAACVLALLAGLCAWAGAASQGADVTFGGMIGAGANCLPAALLFLGMGMLAFAVVPRATAGDRVRARRARVRLGALRVDRRRAVVGARPLAVPPHRARAPAAVPSGRRGGDADDRRRVGSCGCPDLRAARSDRRLGFDIWPGSACESSWRRARARDYELWARTINPQFARVLKTIGFDRTWARAEGAYLWDDGRQPLPRHARRLRDVQRRAQQPARARGARRVPRARAARVGAARRVAAAAAARRGAAARARRPGSSACSSRAPAPRRSRRR